MSKSEARSDLDDKPTVHERFNDKDADVTFESSDKVLLKLHRKNLEIAAGAFPGPEFDTNDEITTLQEPASVLEILFDFAYPGRHQTIKGDGGFVKLMEVAEAAEKYQMYSAMDVCALRLR